MLLRKTIFLIGLLLTSAYCSDKTLYDQKCGICHGVEGMETVMGKSKEIKGMSVEEIVKAMYDYANGDRKSIVMVQSMKKSFINAYDKKTLDNIAKYINKM